MEPLKINQIVYPTSNFSEAKVIGIYPGGQGIYSETHYELLIQDFKVKLPISFINGLFSTKEELKKEMVVNVVPVVEEIKKAQIEEVEPAKEEAQIVEPAGDSEPIQEVADSPIESKKSRRKGSYQ